MLPDSKTKNRIQPSLSRKTDPINNNMMLLIHPYFILCKLVCHSHQSPLRVGEKSTGAPGNIFLATPPQNNKASPPLLSPLQSSGCPISLIGIHPTRNSSYQYLMINSLVRPCGSSKSWLLYPPFKRDA